MALFKAKAGEGVEGLERPWMSGTPDDESKDGSDRFGQIHSAIGSGTKIEGKKRKADSCRKPEGDEQKPEEMPSVLVP